MTAGQASSHGHAHPSGSVCALRSSVCELLPHWGWVVFYFRQGSTGRLNMAGSRRGCARTQEGRWAMRKRERAERKVGE